MILNGHIYVEKLQVQLLSNLKYIGNSEQMNEPFFEMKELRIHERLISHEEYVFMNRRERIEQDNEYDDRISFFDIVNLVYDEFNECISTSINYIIELLLVSPGNNFVSSIEIFTLLARNHKFHDALKDSLFLSYYPLLFNDIDRSARRRNALKGLLNTII